MNLGPGMSEARRKSCVPQEAAAERPGVSRQTISKWEAGETAPGIMQAKRLASIYRVTLDEVTSFDSEMGEIEGQTAKSRPEREDKIDWTCAWGRRHPVLLTYPGTVDTSSWSKRPRAMPGEMREECGFSGAGHRPRPQGHPLPDKEGLEGGAPEVTLPERSKSVLFCHGK